LDDAASAEKLKSKEERRERSVGMKIGKTCYYLFKKGRADTDFPDLLLLRSMNDLLISVSSIIVKNSLLNFFPMLQKRLSTE
jgi:hypothetical protein